MTTEGTKRKLAIPSADAKGYSRLMCEDEKATVETIKKYREVMGELIRQYNHLDIFCKTGHDDHNY
jgi:class 3 adenylate cyclase